MRIFRYPRLPAATRWSGCSRSASTATISWRVPAATSRIGELAALGPQTRCDLAIGTRVSGWWVLPCRSCEQCIGGFPNRCARDYRYLGAHEHGAYAQYVKLPADHLIALPEDVSFEQAAAFPNAFGTAWHMLVVRANLRPSETVLVNSASSGVSMAAIQICKLVGAYVYATSSADWKLAKARELGADEMINYTEADFVDEVMKRTGKRGVDVVVEHVGGDFLGKSIRCLTRGGRLVTVGGTRSYDCTIPVNYIFHKELQIIGSNSATKLDLIAMMPLLASGKLRPVIDRLFPLEQAAQAHQYLEAGKQFGKVVLRVEH
jgi:NADPH:quinone reductase-like Zn-dependent oxidoreductase